MACLLKYIFGRILGVAPTKAFPRTCFNSRPPHVHRSQTTRFPKLYFLSFLDYKNETCLSYFFSIDTVKTQKANFLFKAWKYATTEWLVVRFLHRLQQEVGQIMDCTIPQQMCITQDRLGFKVTKSPT